MKSSSIHKIIQDKGLIAARVYRDCLVHEWYLGQDKSNHLEIYVLKRCSNIPYFFSLINDGEIQMGTKTYSIVWVNSPAIVRKSQHILLSFRYCNILNRGYVLVKEFHPSHSNNLIEEFQGN